MHWVGVVLNNQIDIGTYCLAPQLWRCGMKVEIELVVYLGDVQLFSALRGIEDFEARKWAIEGL